MIAYAINLDRAPGRWASLVGQAAERGLAIERVEAVDGRDPAAIVGNGHRPRAGERHRMTPAEIACFESHRRAWRRVAEAGAPFALVLEDDVFLSNRIADFLAALEGQAPALDLVKLNAHPRGLMLHTRPIATIAGRRLLAPAQRTGDASAYVIARAFAQRALESLRHYSEPLDLELFDPAGAKVAQVVPAAAIQQRYADFRFLDEAARATTIQTPAATRARGAGVAELAARELERLVRRRIRPAVQPFLNPFRAPADRLAFQRVEFANRSV